MTEVIKTNTAKELHEILTDLWPMLNTDYLAIVVDSTAWRSDTVGFYLSDQEHMDQYSGSLPHRHPAGALIDPLYPSHLIVIDQAATTEHGGWKEFLLTALHEFAHAIRNELGEGLYPDFHRLKKIGHYLENQLGEHMGTDAEPPDTLLITDDSMNDIDAHLFPLVESGRQPLFRDWAVRTDQHDGGHDLLFYLVLYFLEREATDRGYFANPQEVVKSVHQPGVYSVVIGHEPPRWFEKGLPETLPNVAPPSWSQSKKSP